MTSPCLGYPLLTAATPKQLHRMVAGCVFVAWASARAEEIEMEWVVQGVESGKKEEEEGQVGCTEKKGEKIQKVLLGEPSACPEQATRFGCV